MAKYPKRFRTRVGELIAHMFGFFVEGTASGSKHSGGRSLFHYCSKKRLDPRELYIGWLENCTCYRCAENEVYDQLEPLLNKQRPGRCTEH